MNILKTPQAADALGCSVSYLKRQRDTHGGFLGLGKHYHRKPQKVNAWMGGWAPLPEEIDLSSYSDWQDRENQRNPSGLMARLWRLIR